MWLGAIGAAVLGAFGASVVAGGLAAMVVGGAIVGAAVGALYQWTQGGNIWKGLLYGAIGGAVMGAGAAALGFGASGTAGAAGPGTAGAAGAAGEGTTLGAYGSVSAKVAPEATSLWTSGGFLKTSEAAMSLGSAFLKGGAAGQDSQNQLEATRETLASQEKRAREANATTLKQAEMMAETSRRNADLSQKTAAERLAMQKDQFSKNFAESKFRYGDEFKKRETARKRNEAGILAASKYVGGSAPTVTEVKQLRQRLPFPAWLQHVPDVQSAQS